MSERGEALLVCERKTKVVEIIFMFSYFTAAIGAHSIFEEVAGFNPLWFPQENYLCLLSLVFISMHVILSVNILR